MSFCGAEYSLFDETQRPRRQVNTRQYEIINQSMDASRGAIEHVEDNTIPLWASRPHLDPDFSNSGCFISNVGKPMWQCSNNNTVAQQKSQMSPGLRSLWRQSMPDVSTLPKQCGVNYNV